MASESILNQMKVVEHNAGARVNVTKQNESEHKFSTERGKFNDKYAQARECGN